MKDIKISSQNWNVEDFISQKITLKTTNEEKRV